MSLSQRQATKRGVEAVWLTKLIVIYGRTRVLSFKDGDKTFISTRKTSPGSHQKHPRWLNVSSPTDLRVGTMLTASTEFYLINPLTGYNHLTCSRSRRGRCEVIARVKSGPHHRGCMVNTWSHFHTWCLPQRKTQTSKPDIFPEKKWAGSNICVKTACCLPEKARLLVKKRMSHYSIVVDWMLTECWYFSSEGAKEQ